MLFYGTFSSGADFHSYLQMAGRPVAVLVLGGALGPVAALFSALGMGLFYLAMESEFPKLAQAAALLLAIMMLTGGAYHAIFTVFGFASRVADPFLRNILIGQVTSLRDAISYPMYAAGLAGTALTYLLALRRNTLFPRWLLLFMPTTLSLGGSLFRSYLIKIPAPLGGIIRGGWINGSFVLFFCLATWTFCRTQKHQTTAA